MAGIIFLVEDEASIAQTLIYTLESEGFSVQWFERAELVLAALAVQVPDFLILDVGLPDMNGFALWRKILAQGYTIPMMFLTAQSEEIDRVLGLEMGADDYVAKPFSPREVSARVRGILRRVAGASPAQTTITTEPVWVLTPEKGQIYFYGQLLELTRYEYLLLKTLVTQPERIFSRALLMDMIWQGAEDSLDRTVDTHIKTIRAKLRVIKDIDIIQTHRGMGYSLRVSK